MKYLILICLLSNIVAAFGQIHVEGTVTDRATGAPIPYTALYVNKDYDKCIAKTRTDENGNFTVKISKNELNDSCKYQIYMSSEIYEKTTVSLVSKNHIQHISIQLNKRSQPLDFHCSLENFDSYVPGEISSITQLPDSIQQIIKEYLIKKVGIDLYSRVHLECGQIVNTKRLYLIEPSYKANSRKVPNYLLRLALIIDQASLTKYFGIMALDDRGNINEEPIFAKIISDLRNEDPAKLHFISKKQVIRSARRHFIYKKKKTVITFTYSNKADCFVWKFETCKYNGPLVYCPIWILAAHSGKIVGKSFKVGKRSFY